MKLFSSDIGHLTYHSKRLAYLLRHSKLPNHKGWIKVDVVQNELGVLLLDIQKIVYEDTKGRFEFSEDKSSVRALYGHSIDVNLGLEPTKGLRPRKRNFVHLSETMDMAKQVGTRHGSPVVLSIDIEAMIRAGYKFYKAQNGIWLTGDIPPIFFKAVCYE